MCKDKKEWENKGTGKDGSEKKEVQEQKGNVEMV
jgi:hypothetical protein